MATLVMANAEFVLWANNNLKYKSTLDTIEALQKANKVDLGKLYVAFRDKKECPTDLVNKDTSVSKCQTCNCVLSRSDIFESHLLGLKQYYCVQHRPASIPAERKEITNNQSLPNNAEPVPHVMCCAKCGSIRMIPSYHIPWIPQSDLPFSNPRCESYACDPCYDILYKTKPNNKPVVKFMTDDC
jgi:hypothetical protein